MSSSVPANKLTPSWDLLPLSLRLARTYAVPLLYTYLLPSLIATLGLLLVGDLQHPGGSSIAGWILIAIGSLAGVFSLAAHTKLQLEASREAEVSIPELYKANFRYLPRLIAFMIVYSVIVLLGLIAFIVPGLIMMRRYVLAPLYIVDKDLSVEAAMRRSAADSKAVSGSIWGLLGVTYTLALAGAVLNLVVPPFGTFIGTLLAWAYVFAPVLRYREMPHDAGKPSTKAGKPKQSPKDWSTVEH